MSMNMATTTSMASMPATSTMSSMMMMMSTSGTAAAAAAMSSGSSMDMDMSMMNMVFFEANDTPLYSNAWMPSSTGTYAATCIFLIFLAAVLRGLLALRHIMDRAVVNRDFHRKQLANISLRQGSLGDASDSDLKNNALIAAECGPSNTLRTMPTASQEIPPFRLTVDLPRALLMTIIVGVAYLLMLAVMTYNLGYFLSVLGGSFVGELLIGRYTLPGDH